MNYPKDSVNKLLVQKAIEAKQNAYAPYSNFRVGSALLTDDDEIITGCNVEVSSFGLTICAERNVIFQAYSKGKRKFKAIALAADTNNYISPCGACRQVISDLCGNIDVIMVNGNGDYKIYKAAELLPIAFTHTELNNRK
ncbi:Cytidine deaminase [Ignavibacterium album JCM 16511]|uniref:Cytidine deaminase n=1 Tax=Ignavibacterium album (strain DSM 19864 / JCM 16511 / NBRC 101810 / Mat9-16) TaxID=945713 RepID=I0AHU4_IGNAJ|nr:cytidine deaminase [Ignavibacterium album]AFH48551.1 Cytidine deaminase [Ignavibacterium album JCM 16511]